MIKTPLFSLLVAFLLVACGGPSGSPAASPSTSPPPGASPSSPPGSPSGDPSPGPVGPSPTPPPTGSPTGDQIVHPTGAHEVILQYSLSGGFVTPDMIVTQAPVFSLYGDGTVIWRPLEDPDQGAGLPRFVRGKLTEEGIQALLAFALGAGRLAGARDHYMQDSCADCQTSTFVLNAAGMSKTVAVDALGMEERLDQVDRAGFLQLAELLGNFDEQARTGVAGEIELYDPPLYLVVLTEAVPEMGEFGEWPWSDVTAADFGPRGEGGWQREAYLTREQVALVTDVPSGGTLGILVEDADGKLWSVALRPLMPDEVAEAQTQ